MSRSSLVFPFVTLPLPWLRVFTLILYSVEHYPQHNCDLGLDNTVKSLEQTQQLFQNEYLTHAGSLDYVQQYIATSAEASSIGVDVYMLEVNCFARSRTDLSFSFAFASSTPQAAVASLGFQRGEYIIGSR